mmetsp:Transcript_6520/g.22485  ORF Transcript_6520/g.22485 Transcript_6520/m.22485 type:complete len:218 (+) Transcript_6520:185-838(+)
MMPYLRPQPTGPRLARHGVARDRTEGGVVVSHLCAVHAQEGSVLLHQRVLWLRKNFHELVLVERVQGSDHGEPPDELRDEAVADHVRRVDLAQHPFQCSTLGSSNSLTEAYRCRGGALGDNLVEADEGAPTYEQDVLGVHLDEVPARVLAPAFLRYINHRALDHLKQRLLHPLPGHVPRDGHVLRFLGYLVDLVDVYDALLRGGEVEASGLQELVED